jgi:hypothetical protein
MKSAGESLGPYGDLVMRIVGRASTDNVKELTQRRGVVIGVLAKGATDPQASRASK